MKEMFATRIHSQVAESEKERKGAIEHEQGAKRSDRERMQGAIRSERERANGCRRPRGRFRA